MKELNITYSKWIDSLSAVPQDSVIGPLLFYIFLSDQL